MAGIVLLLNIWGGKRSGLSTDPLKEMADVHKCMGLLKSLENRYVPSFEGDRSRLLITVCRWHTAGRLWFVITKANRCNDT